MIEQPQAVQEPEPIVKEVAEFLRAMCYPHDMVDELPAGWKEYVVEAAALVELVRQGGQGHASPTYHVISGGSWTPVGVRSGKLRLVDPPT